ncbi:MAG: hypothetical protein V2A74_05010, partial [bacterium]
PTGISGFTADVTLAYVVADVTVGTESLMKVQRNEGGSVWTAFSLVNASTHVGTATGVTALSDWTVSEPSTAVQDWRLF